MCKYVGNVDTHIQLFFFLCNHTGLCYSQTDILHPQVRPFPLLPGSFVSHSICSKPSSILHPCWAMGSRCVMLQSAWLHMWMIQHDLFQWRPSVSFEFHSGSVPNCFPHVVQLCSFTFPLRRTTEILMNPIARYLAIVSGESTGFAGVPGVSTGISWGAWSAGVFGITGVATREPSPLPLFNVFCICTLFVYVFM